jgi:hypothetical protein
MTLIVAVAYRHYAFHASDRYVSVQPTPQNPGGDWDMHANKTVIAVGSDCWLALGYTGLAYLEGKPTDQLIAEAISGVDDLPNGAAFIPWFVPKLPHYREIRDRIEQKLADAYSRLPKSTADKYPTLVLASGIQRKNNLIHGVMFRITVQGSASDSVELTPSTIGPSQFYINAVGMVNNPVIDRAKDRLSQPTANSLEQVRDILMDAVIETSRLTDYVGEDVMGVILDKQNEKISTHFRRVDPQRQAELLDQVGTNIDDRFKQMATVSTPYVLTPGMIFGPAVGNPGGWSLSSGINFHYSGFDFDPPKPGGAFLAGQPRKPQP